MTNISFVIEFNDGGEIGYAVTYKSGKEKTFWGYNYPDTVEDFMEHATKEELTDKKLGDVIVYSMSYQITFTKIDAGIYKTNNGFFVKSNAGMSIWGKPMAADYWYIYISDRFTQENRITGYESLAECKDALNNNRSGFYTFHLPSFFYQRRV